MRPPITTLKLTNPRMEGELVKQIQKRLGIEVDGVFGCQTARRVRTWLWRAGAPEARPALTPQEILILLGLRPRPTEWKRQTASRLISPGNWIPIPGEFECNDPVTKVGELRFVSRAEAGLRPSRGTSFASHGPGIPHVIHWIGPGKGAVGLEASLAQLRGFQNYHMDGHGWSDIGYNWAIPNVEGGGIVVECRGRNVRGAHSGHNVANTYPGVVILIGLEDPGPTQDQLNTLMALREHEGWGRRYGHWEFFGTSCPGPVLTSFIQTHR